MLMRRMLLTISVLIWIFISYFLWILLSLTVISEFIHALGCSTYHYSFLAKVFGDCTMIPAFIALGSTFTFALATELKFRQSNVSRIQALFLITPVAITLAAFGIILLGLYLYIYDLHALSWNPNEPPGFNLYAFTAIIMGIVYLANGFLLIWYMITKREYLLRKSLTAITIGLLINFAIITIPQKLLFMPHSYFSFTPLTPWPLFTISALIIVTFLLGHIMRRNGFNKIYKGILFLSLNIWLSFYFAFCSQMGLVWFHHLCLQSYGKHAQELAMVLTPCIYVTVWVLIIWKWFRTR